MKLVMFLNITKYENGSMIFFCLPILYSLTFVTKYFQLQSPCLNRGFEAADFHYNSLTKHQKQYNTYEELSTQLMTT